MTTSYEQSELLQKIREDYGRTDDEGVTTTPTALQDELRSGESESGEPSRKIVNSRRRAARNQRGTTATERTPQRNNSRKRRASTKVDESDSGLDVDSRSDYGTVQSPAVESIRHEKESKPSGLDLKPNAIERKVRQEKNQAEAAAKEQSHKKDGFFGFIHPDNRSKTGKEKEPLRNKPLSEREAEELRPQLLAALLDYFKIADECIYATNKKGHHVVIWSAIDDEDAGVLVDVWLARAKMNTKTASHVVFAVQKHAELQVGIILLPKFYQTFRAYVDGGGFGVRHEN